MSGEQLHFGQHDTLSIAQDLGFVCVCSAVMTIAYAKALNQPPVFNILKSKMPKFIESCFGVVIYLIQCTWGFTVLMNEHWPLETKYFYIGWPHHPFQTLFKFYYLFQFSFYVQQSIVLLFIAPRRKDFWEYVVHHVVTLMLISVSYFLRHIRIGLIVLLVHDVSDVFLHLAKAFIYAQMKTAVDVVFAIFALVFFVTRLIILPYVTSSIWWEPQLYVEDFDIHKWQINFWLVSLSCLIVLHVIWFSMIIRMIVSSLRSGGVDSDIRSDDEEEEELTDNDKSSKTGTSAPIKDKSE